MYIYNDSKISKNIQYCLNTIKQRNNHIKSKKNGYRRTVEGLQDLFNRLSGLHRELENINPEMVIDVLNEQYNEDWDIEVVEKKPFIELYYPSLVITNGDQNHTIKDLFACVNMLSSEQSVYITKCTFTPSEIVNEYIHSHVPGNILNTFNANFLKLCLGNSNFRLDLRSKIKFRTSLMHLDAMLKTESKIHQPYRYISNLWRIRGNDSYYKSMIHNDLIIDINDIIYGMYNDLHFIVSKDNVQLKHDEQYEKLLMAILKRDKNHFYFIKSNNKYLLNNNDMLPLNNAIDRYKRLFLDNNDENMYTFFRDKKFAFKVVKEDKEEEEEEKINEICLYVNKELQEQINNIAVQKYIEEKMKL